MLTLSRRQMIVSTAAAGLPLVLSPAQAALTQGAEKHDFKVFRNGTEIGHHKIDLRHEGNRTIADIEIFLEVSFGPIVVFRYNHTNQEIWEDGRFLSFRSVTNDDGDDYSVFAERRDGVIRIERGHDSDYETDDLSLLPTTYWNADTITRSRLIDSQKGRIFDVGIARGSWQQVDPGSGPVEAQQFTLSGDLSLDLWYDRSQRLTKMAFELGGADFDYKIA